MSSVYILEPPTKGKVVLNTSLGPLDFELWPKEAPKAVRNFVQLCLEGYYDNTFFHRIIKNFMIQGGDPTGTGKGGDTIYGELFADEFHSRLRFNHRGLVACANAGSANSNNSQFFMTLDRCDWLDKKNTIFGKVTGDTVYNLLKIGEVETDKEDRPVDPPRILSVEVLWNPFEDIIPRSVLKPTEIREKVDAVNKEEKKGRKVKKELNLLSFGEEAEEEEQQLATVKEKKIKSSHDVLRDPRLLKAPSDAAEHDASEAKRRKDVQESVRQALGGSVKIVDHAEQKQEEAQAHDSDEDEVDFDKRMREQIMKKRMNMGDTKAGGSDRKQGSSSAVKKSNGPTPALSSRPNVPQRNADKTKEEDDSDDEGEKKEKLVIKKKGLGSEARAELAAAADLDMQLLSPLEQQRAKYKQKKRTLQGREENTLAKLEKFKKKLNESKEKATKSAEPERAKDDEGWLAHSLKFEADSKRDDMARNDDPNQYVVQDPLLEKGKEKFNKMQAKFKKRGREWAGNSLT